MSQLVAPAHMGPAAAQHHIRSLAVVQTPSQAAQAQQPSQQLEGHTCLQLCLWLSPMRQTQKQLLER
jgi:hypothetical protein